MFWYIGLPAVILATVGAALLSRRCLRGQAPAWTLPLITFAWAIVTFLYRPAITPDQPWASRRLVPAVLPGFILLAVWASSWLVGWLDGMVTPGCPASAPPSSSWCPAAAARDHHVRPRRQDRRPARDHARRGRPGVQDHVRGRTRRGRRPVRGDPQRLLGPHHRRPGRRPVRPGRPRDVRRPGGPRHDLRPLAGRRNDPGSCSASSRPGGGRSSSPPRVGTQALRRAREEGHGSEHDNGQIMLMTPPGPPSRSR